MTRKQEAIKVLSEEVRHCHYHSGTGEILGARESWARSLYDRIAPLMPWEFPDAKMRELLRDADLSKEELFWKIKCLCEGQHPREGDNILEQEDVVDEAISREYANMEDEQPKGTCPSCNGTGRILQSEESKEEGFVTASVTNDHPCPKCGGSGKHVFKLIWSDPHITTGTNEPSSYEAKDCPDCDGTGECQHKNVVEVKDDLPIRIYCDDCQQYLKNRRSGKDRRVDKSATAFLCDPPDEPRLIYYIPAFRDWWFDLRTIPERRKERPETAHSKRSGA